MDRLEALEIFGLNSPKEQEEIIAAIEERLFATKNEVLQKYMVPTLIAKRVSQLHDVLLAEYLLLDGEIPAGNEIRHWAESPPDRIAMISQYEEFISHLKLELMNCRTFHQLHKVMQAFILAQEYYMVLFRMLFNEFSEALPEEVNTREMIDTGKLLVELKKGHIENNQTWAIERELARIDKIRNLKQSV